jgi:hypothetical protein
MQFWGVHRVYRISRTIIGGGQQFWVADIDPGGSRSALG